MDEILFYDISDEQDLPPPSICEMAKDVSDGTKTITIPLMTPETVSGSIILKNIVTLFAPRSRGLNPVVFDSGHGVVYR